MIVTKGAHMGEELIYRKDCNLAAEGFDGIIRNLMLKHKLEGDKIYDFARELLQIAQSHIELVPTITTDEYVAIKCPECNNIYIEDNDIFNSFCPVCGIKYKIDY